MVTGWVSSTFRRGVASRMAEQEVYALLTAGVPALGDRVYPSVLPQNVAYPAATYQRISTIRYSAFAADVDAVEAVIQVDVYDKRGQGYTAFTTLTEAVRGALQRASSGNIIQTFLDAERDDYEDDTDLYRKSYDVRTWFRET